MSTPCSCTIGERGGCDCHEASSAKIIPILDKTQFNFTALKASTGTGPASTIDVVVCTDLCILDYYRVRLAVRVHSLTVSATDQAIEFLAFGAMPSEEDPGSDFVNPNAFASLIIDDQTVAPCLVTATGSDPDAYLKIIIRATQGVSVLTLSAVLSACLILRERGSR